MLDIIICVVGWVIIAWHTWALKNHFDMPKAPVGVRILSILVLGSAATFSFLILTYEQPLTPQIISLVLLGISGIMFSITMKESKKAKLLAAFDEKMPHGLLKTGPYSMVRHPFYTSYLIQWIGWAFAAWSVLALAPLLVMLITYYKAATDEENKFASTPMADEYARYKKHTGRFFPRLLN